MPRCTTADGVEIEYDDAGQGRPVVFVHGITDDRSLWAPIVDRLVGEARCLCLDLRGHGGSGDGPDSSSFAMTQDVAAVVSAAGLAEPPVVVGHSLGGVVVTLYAAAAPVAAVVNVDQPLRFSDFAAALAPLEPALRGEGFHDALAAIFSAMEGERVPRALAARLLANRRRARQEVVMGAWDMVFTSPAADLDAVAEQLGPAITVPYLALHGLPLASGYAEWLSGVLPQAMLEEWPGDGHYLHLVDPDRFGDRLRAFLASVP